jgi:hypothetical protein
VKRFLLQAAIILFTSLPAAEAATITSFARGTNDGVFALTAAQKAYFKLPDAAYIGFFRPRAANNAPAYAVGDTFDANTIFNSVSGDTNILAVLNGDNLQLDYSGDYLAPLKTTTVTVGGTSFYRGVALLLKANSVVNFAGGNFSTQSNSAQIRATFDWEPPAEVPLPAAAPLFIAALGSLWFLRRRVA